MALTNVNSLFVDHQKILASFANAQMENIDPSTVKANQFLLFAVTSFLYGAINQLGKQSNLPINLQQKYLQNILCEIFKLPRHNAEGLLSSIERMMGNYYLLENIHQDGQNSAEKWLNSESTPCDDLKTLTKNYQDFTLLDMKAAGMKTAVPEFEEQPTLSQNNNNSRSWLKAILWMLVLAIVTGGSLAYYFEKLPI